MAFPDFLFMTTTDWMCLYLTFGHADVGKKLDICEATLLKKTQSLRLI